MSKRKKNRGKFGAATANRSSGGGTGSSEPLSGKLLPAGTARDPVRWKRLLIFAGFVLLMAGGYAVYLAYEEGYWPFVEKPIRGKLLPGGWEDGQRKSATWKEIEEQMRKRPPQKKWDLEKWSPVSDDDKLIDRFVKLHGAGDARAQDLLAPQADKAPANDAEEERRDAGAFLRKDKVRIVDVWRGVPNGDRPPLAAAKRYVLVTRGGGSLPSGYSLNNPLVVVEVQGQKIQPLRTEINQRPE
jgi:hypothetical protein